MSNELKTIILNKIEECHKLKMTVNDMITEVSKIVDLNNNKIYDLFNSLFFTEYGVNKYLKTNN